MTAGARQRKAWEILEISAHTYQRWSRDEATLHDSRPDAQRPVPANKLSTKEREAILAASNSPTFRHSDIPQPATDQVRSSRP